jgi:hypothetical protein
VRWLVTFTAPVVYQAGHPKAERTITALEVSSATARQAEIHALRTVQGDADVASCVPYDRVPAVLPVESIPDVRQEY